MHGTKNGVCYLSMRYIIKIYKDNLFQHKFNGEMHIHNAYWSLKPIKGYKLSVN